MWFALLAATAHCWLMQNCSPATRLPLCTCVQHYSIPGAEPRIYHCSTSCDCLVLQSRSLCKVSHPSRESTAPPNLALSANSWRMHLIHTSRSLIKVLNRARPAIELWGTPLATAIQVWPHSLQPFDLYHWASSSFRIAWTCLSHSWAICPEGCHVRCLPHYTWCEHSQGKFL